MTMQQTKTTSHAISSMYLRTRKGFYHKVHAENHSVCPLVGIGTAPPPHPPASVYPTPEPKGGGVTLACGWGGGGVSIRTTGKKAKHSVYSYVLCGFSHHSRSLKSTATFFSSLDDNLHRYRTTNSKEGEEKESFIHDKNAMETLPVTESKGCHTWRKLQERIKGYVVFKWNIRSWETGCCRLN